MEVLVVNTGIASNIREGKTHQISSAMQTGKGIGMQTFNDALIKLVADGLITPKEAYSKALDKDAIARQMTAAGIAVEAEAGKAGANGEEPQPELTIPLEDFINQCVEKVRQDPTNAEALNNMAWMLVSSDNPQLRNAAEAMRAAHQAHSLTGGRNPAVLDTLGAVYAEVGEFDKALEWARKGFHLAQTTGQLQLADALAQRIHLYEMGQPHRQKDKA
jgi:tetratricopeptide (TPR) repeat protein